MGRLLGVTREWISKLENGREEFSEFIQMKMDAVEKNGVTQLHKQVWETSERVEEPSPTPQGAPRDTLQEIDNHHQRLLLAADGDPVRLGWIREQQRAHLAIPAHWQSKGSGITRVYDRAQKTALSTHTGLPVPGPSQRTRSA